MDESEDGPDGGDDDKKIPSEWHNKSSVILHSGIAACRLAARAVLWEMGSILSPAAEKREQSPNC